MPDRMTLILQLEQLRSEAVQRGDDRASDILCDAAELLFADRRIDKVRQTDRRRKTKTPADSSGIQRNPAESTAGHSGFPHTPFQKTEEEEKARARETTDHDRAKSDPMYELNRGLLEERMGDLFPDALRFVEQRGSDRPPVTWAGWYGAMLSILTGGKATPADLAQVCRDDTALTRPVGSPKGLRVFVANAVEERLQGPAKRPPFAAGAQAGYGARRENPNGARPLAATEMLLGEDR